MRILDSKNEDLKNIIKKAPNILDSISKESQENFSYIKKCLNELKIDYVENPYLVRGLDYYNDIVLSGNQTQLGHKILYAGEEDMIHSQKLLGREANAIGFSIGLERLSLLLEDSQIPILNLSLLYLWKTLFFWKE